MSASVFVSGDRKAVMGAVDSATVIAKGDLVYLDVDDIKPLTSLGDSGTKAQNQAAAKAVFAGVALRSSASGETLAIPVATSGVFEFDCASASFELGGPLGPIGTGSASAVGVSASSLESVGASDVSIASVYKRGTSVTRVQAEIYSTVLKRPVPADEIGSYVTPTAETTVGPTLTAAKLRTKLITSTQTGAVTATLDTGTAMDTALAATIPINGYFDWTLINLGSASGAATVTAAAGGHTVVGSGLVAISTSGTFRSVRTAANTWITYRK